MIPFVLQAENSDPGSESTELVTDKVPSNCIVTVTNICARDVGNAVGTSIEIGRIKDGMKHVIKCAAGSIASSISVNVETDIVLGPGEALYAVFNNATADDRLFLFGHGFLCPAEQPMHHGEHP